MSIVVEKGDSFVGVSGQHCRFCQNKDPELFYRYFDYAVGKEVTYCRACIQMTRSTTESWYGLKECEITSEVLNCSLDFELTVQQQSASNIITEAVRLYHSKLLHAVTGAGKTEMILQGIIEARKSGRAVAIVSPRVDVVKEVALRMTSYFDTKIDVLYAGEQIMYNSQFVICTVHQLMKYRNHFGLIIVDEVDAFPIPMDRRLMEVIRQSACKQHTAIYLTATPSKKLLKQFRAQDIITLPKRYHNRPLPVPVYRFLPRKSILKGGLSAALGKRKTGTVLLVFFNDIHLMQQAAECYQLFRPLTVYAGDEDRHDKVMRIRSGSHPVIFTTTILERGFTMDKLDVWVIDSGTFTAECLIQMAGRVDRKKVPYKGEVIYFHEGVTRSMMKAVKEIKRMNRLAR